jgi:hypothetical protein
LEHDLRVHRKKAIKDCDFIKAKMIDRHLKRLVDETDESVAARAKLQNKLDYSNAKEAVRGEASKAYSAAIEEIYRIESEFQVRIAALISLHAEELTAHALPLAAELELSSTRKVPDEVVLEREAKAVAKIGDFDLAQSLYERGKAVEAQTIADRQVEIREIYDRLQKQLEERHAAALKLTNEKKLSKLGKVVREYNATVDRLKKQLANAAFRFQIAQEEEDDAGLFPEIQPTTELPVPVVPTRSPSRSQSGSTGGSPKSGGSQTWRSPRGQAEPRPRPSPRLGKKSR